MIKYNIYPSVLDKFKSFLESELDFESPFNIDSEGNYKRSFEEISEENRTRLLDTINRVKSEPTEAADAGTCLNEVVDRLVLNQKYGREDIQCWSDQDCIHSTLDGFEFMFSKDLCRSLRDYLKESSPQYRCEAVLDTKYGDVNLYGFIDYVGMDRIIDLKTTSRYEFGKYSEYNQKDVYPYCMVKSGDMEEVKEFEFLAVQWKKRVNAPWEGSIYKEVYTIRMDDLTKRLRANVERFIEWLEDNRNLITDKKIFNEQ